MQGAINQNSSRGGILKGQMSPSWGGALAWERMQGYERLQEPSKCGGVTQYLGPGGSKVLQLGSVLTWVGGDEERRYNTI